MKRITLTLCLASFLFACNSDKKGGDTKTTTDSSGTDAIKVSQPMPDSATMMKNWQDYMTPGDMHKMMAKWDGNWENEVTVWMYPGAPPEISKSNTVNKMILNGLYQESTNTGTMMGMPFNGKGTLAYDNQEKQFISTWIDNMGSGVMVTKGPWDEATKTCTLTGRMVDPGLRTYSDVRETFKVIDDNTQELEMFVKGADGKEMKTMNIKYKRK